MNPAPNFERRLSVAEFRARIDSLLAEAARELDRTRVVTDRLAASASRS